MERTPASVLRDAADLFEAKDSEYGNTWVETQIIMTILFPEGITLKTAAEFSRFGTLQYIVTKLRRYCHNFEKGGHLDSAKDLQVFASMLEIRTDVK